MTIFFFRSVQGTLQRGARASIALPFGAAEAQRMNWARVSDLFHLPPDTNNKRFHKKSFVFQCYR